MKLINLGWSVAKLEEDKALLTIISPSDGSESSYCPAESVRIFGRDALEALRDALNDAYPVTPNKEVRGAEQASLAERPS